MRVGLLSYPMLFQHPGGLQVQLLQTRNALRELEIDAVLVEPSREKLKDFDLIHVFSMLHGNGRIVEAAKASGRPVVLSPQLHASWTRSLGRRGDFIDRLVGRATGWQIQTSYGDIKRTLALSDHLIALGDVERTAITHAFGIARARVSVVPNGIDARFFSATAAAFTAATGIAPGFALNVASINPRKNQRALVEALRGTGRQVVLIGPVEPRDQAYLDRLKAHDHVRYLGVLPHDDPVLGSAYAAAGVCVLPSDDEVMPLALMESLAAGKPVVVTRNHSMDLKAARGCVAEVHPPDIGAIRDATLQFLQRPPTAAQCRAAVRDYRWDTVALQLLGCYRRLLGVRAAAPRMPAAMPLAWSSRSARTGRA